MARNDHDDARDRIRRPKYERGPSTQRSRGDRPNHANRPREPRNTQPAPAALPLMEAGSRTGRCARVVESKGYGFIQDDRSQVDLFFHYSDYDRTAPEVRQFNQLVFDAKAGDRVAFRAEATPKGWRAREVYLVAQAEPGND